MPYSKKIVLRCQSGATLRLEQLVEDFLQDGVLFVAVVGLECDRIEDIIDEHVVGDGTDEDRFILTSSHPGATVEETVAFARCLAGRYAGDVVQVVELLP